MNRIYRLVFNRALGVTQAVAEIATRQQGGASRDVAAHRPRHTLLALSLGSALMLASGGAFAAFNNGGPARTNGGNGGSGMTASGGGAGGGNTGGGMAATDGDGVNGSAGKTNGDGTGGSGGPAAVIVMGSDSSQTLDVTGNAGGNGTGHAGGGGGGVGVSVPGDAASDGDTTYAAISNVIIHGGAGGNGAAGDATTAGGGGGGGGAALVLGTRVDMTQSGVLAGGTGGTAGYNAGGGGGGTGVLMNGENSSLFNYGSISGGNGGSGGTLGNAGSNSAGVMITGSDNYLRNIGSIAGGWSGTGSSQGEAIYVQGDRNTVRLVGGSTTQGRILSQGNDNALQVEGVGDTSSAIEGFNTFKAFDDSQWVMNNYVSSTGDAFFDIEGAGSKVTFASAFVANEPLGPEPDPQDAQPGITKSGAGTLELVMPLYYGNTLVSDGTLILHNGPTSTYQLDGGTLDAAGGTLTMTGLSGAGGQIVNASSLTLNQATEGSYAGDITVGNFIKQQNARFTLTGNLTATATISGLLQIGNGGTTGSFTGNATGSTGGLAFDRTDDVTYAGDAAVQNLSQVGTGILTLTGNNSASLIDIDAGTLRAGSDGALGHGIVSLFNDSTFAFGGNQSFANTFVLRGNVGFDVAEGDTGTLTGALPDATGSTVKKTGAGTLVLDTELTATGQTTVAEGALVVGSTADSGGKIDGTVFAGPGTTVGGFGNIAGPLHVLGATVAPGMSQIGVLSVGQLALANAHVAIDLGTPGTGDRIDVAGDAGSLGSVIDVNNLGGLGTGVYRVLTFGGELHGSDLVLGSTPTGTNLTLRYLSDEKAFDIISLGNLSLNYWNADGLASSTHAGGGSGTWSTTSPVFSDAEGNATSSMNPQPGFAIFGGAAGTVTVDGEDGGVAAKGMQFMTDGYHMQGDALQLVGDNGAAPIIRVGDGSTEGAAITATIDNVLTGTDGLQKTDAGTLVLGALNTFTGGVTVSGGTLQVANDRSLGGFANTVTLDGGTLHVTGGPSTLRNYVIGSGDGGIDIDTNYSIRGTVSGDGALHKGGAGTLSLYGDNSYAGGTWLDAGSLVASSDSALGTGDLHMAENTVLGLAHDGMTLANRIIVNGDPTIDVAAGTSATISGAIVDGATPGDIVKIDDGTLRLTGTNTYTGGTTVSQGKLIVGDGATSGSIVGDVAIESGGNLTFDRSDAITFAGAISGEGTLTKLGSNTLRLSGDSSDFTGTTQVAGGVLDLSGSLGGSLVLAQNAVLTGAGTLGQVVVNSGTSMTPGGDNAIGSFDVSGNLTFANGSTYVVNTAADGSSDTVNVAGHASLQGATVRSLQGTGSYRASTRYTILTAATGVQGTFGNLTSDLAFLTPTLSYDATHVYLDLLRNDTSFRSLAANANQAATADAIESQGAGVPVYDAVVALDATDVPPALGQLAGVSLASARTAMVDDARQVRETVQRHLLGTGDGSQTVNGAWASAWGHWGDRDGSAGVDRLRSNGGGVLVGADRDLSGVTFGGTVGAGNLTARSGNDSVQGHSRIAGLYAAGEVGAWQWQAGAMYGWNRLDSHRRVSVDGLAGSASARYDANVAQAYVDGGYRFTFTHGTLTPFVNVARVQLDQDGIHERNSDAALDVRSQNDGVTLGSAGLRGTMMLGDGISAHATLAYQQAWGDVRPYDTQRFVAGGDSFTVAGAPLARHAALADAGFAFAVARNVTVSASYHGLFGGGAKDQGARLGLEVKW